MNQVFFIIGVSGSGKSTVGKLLSKQMNIPFFDGDDFHPEENIKKMSNGIPLADDDRHGWLLTLNELAKKQLENRSCVIVCSALKQKYRELLSAGFEKNTKWIHLSGSFEKVFERMNNREGHFMSSDLLKSQIDTLEEPEHAITIDIQLTPEEIVKKIKNEMLDKSEFGLLGLGVMGKSLCRNLANNGFKISMYNRHVEGLEENVALDFKNEYQELSSVLQFDKLEDFVNSIQKPRKIMLMVNAGKTVDIVIDDLLSHLYEGDILIDGGNSNYINTKERFNNLKKKNIHFIGTGVSGGEEGALKGPSIMPSGDLEAYKKVQPFLETIAAKDENNLPCCTYVGPEGSGHFVKMVHNGIEYAEMQLLAEVFSILSATGKNPGEIADVLETWKNEADSYLLNITINILQKKEDNDWLINKILDKAENKGTGNWAAKTSAELGIPSTLIASSLFARYLSFYKEERLKISNLLDNETDYNLNLTSEELLKAYQFARIINHYQGFNLMSEASKAYSWNLNLSEIARIWTNGCIIRSDLMTELVTVLKESENLISFSKITEIIKKIRPSANKVVSQCVLNNIPAPCLSEAVNFLNGLSTTNSSANLIQAQRDYFGAHHYQRLDDETGQYYHTKW